MSTRILRPQEIRTVLQGATPVVRRLRSTATGSHQDIAVAAAADVLNRIPADIAVEEQNGTVKRFGTVSDDVLVGVSGRTVRFERSHAAFRADGDVLQQLKTAIGSSVRFAADPADGTVFMVDSISPPPPASVVKHPLFPTITALQKARPQPKPPFPTTERLRQLHNVLGMQPHIPFAYPKNGCWARAEAMCQLLIGFLGINQRLVSKIWISCSTGSAPCFEVPTKVNPDCKVRWFWHVAPLVETEKTYLVMDPSLSDKPVDRAGWRALVHGTVSTAKFEYSTPDRWGFSDSLDVDAAEKARQLKRDLAEYRDALSLQIIGSGPIPYAKCGLP